MSPMTEQPNRNHQKPPSVIGPFILDLFIGGIWIFAGIGALLKNGITGAVFLGLAALLITLGGLLFMRHTAILILSLIVHTLMLLFMAGRAVLMIVQDGAKLLSAPNGGGISYLISTLVVVVIMLACCLQLFRLVRYSLKRNPALPEDELETKPGWDEQSKPQ